MNITMGCGMKSRYWCCDRRKEHKDGKPYSLGWDYGMPSKAKRYVSALRGNRAKRRSKLKKEGKPVFTAIKKRKPWQREISKAS